MVRDYFNKLRAKGGFTYAYISKASDTPEATVRKIFTGETEDPRFETVVRIDAAMGGQIANIISGKMVSDMEANAVITMKETYESRLTDQKEHLTTLKRANKILTIVAVILGIALVGLLVLDIAIATHGWIRH